MLYILLLSIAYCYQHNPKFMNHSKQQHPSKHKHRHLKNKEEKGQEGKSYSQYYYDSGNPPVMNSYQQAFQNHPASVVMGKYKGYSKDSSESGLAMTCVYFDGYQQHVEGQDCNVETGNLVFEKGSDDGKCVPLMAATDKSGSKPTGDETMILVCVKG